MRRASEVLQIDVRMLPEIATVQGLMRQFAEVPMSVTDACLVWMTELDAQSVVFTRTATSVSVGGTGGKSFRPSCQAAAAANRAPKLVEIARVSNCW